MTAPDETSLAARPPFLPVPVAELELADPTVPAPNARGEISLLVRLHGVPLGVLPRHDAGPADLRARALATFAGAVDAHLAADGLTRDDLIGSDPGACALATPGSGLRATVVVCTLGREPRLVRTVTSVLASTHRDLELLVVDNDPASGRVAALLQDQGDSRLRIVSQPRRGLSAARNAGLAAAGGDVVAFTDDDAYADPDWLQHLLRPFEEHPAVQCVTGLVLPAEIDSPAQELFEQFGGFDKGFSRTVWVLGPGPAGSAALGARGAGGVLFPYSAGVYGSGNNMAFRTSWLRTAGGFDEALGAGTATRGGEDLDAFLTVLLTGGVLVYEPRALVRHSARGDLAGLTEQVYGYGSGMAAVLVKHVVTSHRRAGQVLARVPAGLRRLLDPASGKNAARTATYPRELVRTELRGYLAGPALYARSRREAARRRRRHP